MSACLLFVTAQILLPEAPTMGLMATMAALARCTDVASLRSELHALCSTFGPVARMDILPVQDRAKRQVVCFIRLSSADQERRMISQLGVARFGNEMFMVLDLAN